MSYNCPKCKSEIMHDVKFCHACGCNLELENIKKHICPKCYTTYPSNAKFCVNDGSKLAQSEDLALNKNITKRNSFATIGFSLSIISVFLYSLSIFPLLSVIFSIIGIVHSKKSNGVGLYKSIAGLIIGCIYLLMTIFGPRY